MDVVLIQHEYGIFGGPDGSFVLELADELRTRHVPYVVTLHTVLAQPTRGQEATLAALCHDAARITVFSRDGARLEGRIAGSIPPGRIISPRARSVRSLLLPTSVNEVFVAVTQK